MKAATLLSLLSVTGLVAAAPAGNGPAGGIIDRDLPVPVPGLPTKGLPIVDGLTGGNKGGEKPGSKVTPREDPTGSAPDGKGNDGPDGDLTGRPGQGGLDNPFDLPTPELPPVKLPGGLDGGKGGLGLRRRGSPVDGLPVVGPVVGGVLGGGGAGSGAGAKGGAGSGTVGRRGSPVDGLPVVGPVVGGVLGGGGAGSGAGAKGGAGSGTPKRRDGPVDGVPVVGELAEGATGGLLGGDAGSADAAGADAGADAGAGAGGQ
ncbi:hypothetical protein AFCA_006109 [Aspergillus flavus]|uniref:Uncharacterized protein n=2 Tax=Aspergillus subgen. Circumdati TaxID=2720871 RepID=A0A1S9DZ37_ASPOZ|nr:hypothetical protein OAory_01027610 [Aspergillus oryzae]RMZ39103.1 collagen EMF1-alpha precursor [Aspergillus flavus]UDD58678.1 hypothetical protein AFCA_006109 [Aspergillus flavus]